MNNHIRKFLDNILDVIFPKTCPVCDEALEHGELICSKCSMKLEYIEEPRCKKCGKQLNVQEQEYCKDCCCTKHLYTMGIGVFLYNDAISKSIYRFKYHNRRTYAEFYGKIIAEKYGDGIKRWEADIIVPIPIHKRKHISRGYNQAELIAMEMSKWINIPVDAKNLIRIVKTKPQKELNRVERKKNLENAFQLCSNVVKYKKVILVDDIYTTGSTIDECAKVLLEAGAKAVYFVSLSIGAGI